MRRILLLVALLAMAGCTGPVRSYDVYRSKAGQTAKAATSAVQTARLAVQAATRHGTGGRYLAQVLAEADDDAGAAQQTFDAIQPPDARSDRLRAQLDDLLDQAVTGLDALRIAARRGRGDELPELARPLAGTASKLDGFAEANAG